MTAICYALSVWVDAEVCEDDEEEVEMRSRPCFPPTPHKASLGSLGPLHFKPLPFLPFLQGAAAETHTPTCRIIPSFLLHCCVAHSEAAPHPLQGAACGQLAGTCASSVLLSPPPSTLPCLLHSQPVSGPSSPAGGDWHTDLLRPHLPLLPAQRQRAVGRGPRLLSPYWHRHQLKIMS